MKISLGGVEVMMEMRDFGRHLAIWCYDPARRPEGKTLVLKNVTFEWGEISEGAHVEPSIEITSLSASEFVPKLVERMRALMLLPPAPVEVKEDVQALKYHIEDLREMLGLGNTATRRDVNVTRE